MALVTNQTELQQALDQGAPLIEIASDFTLQNQIMITYSVTIQSSDENPIQTLTRQTGYTGRLFYVETGGNLTLRNLILDGDKANAGTATSVIGTVSALTLENVVIQNNLSVTNGGGIYVDGPEAIVNMEDCIIRNCECQNNSGAGMYIINSSPIITNCTFTGNTANNNGGGGAISTSGASPVLTGCMFSDNTAAAGGALETLYSSNPTVTDCCFKNNQAYENGGGVGNNHSNPTFTRCLFADNSALLNGGGIDTDFCTPTFIDCVFSGNRSGWWGGGLNTGDHRDFVTLQNCIFKDNTAKINGGGVNLSVCNIAMTDCTFLRNTSSNSGGGLYGYHSLADLKNCTFLDNSSQYGGGVGFQNGGISFEGGYLRGNKASLFGGGIGLNSEEEKQPATAEIAGVDLCDNHAEKGGGVFADAHSNLTFKNGAIRRNTASENGGGICLEGNGQAHLFAPVAMFGNSAGTFGDGIYNGNILGLSDAVTIQDGVFLPSEANFIQVEGSLTNAFVQLEQSPYISPDRSRTPIDVAAATTDYPTLTSADSAAFLKPPSGFDRWYVHMNDDDTRVRLDFLTEYTLSYNNLMEAHNPNPTTYNALSLPIMLLPPNPIPCHCFLDWYDTSGNRVTQISVNTEGNLILQARWERIPAPPMPCCCPICCCCRCRYGS